MIYVNGTTIKFSFKKGGLYKNVFFKLSPNFIEKSDLQDKKHIDLLFSKEILLIKLRKNTDF